MNKKFTNNKYNRTNTTRQGGAPNTRHPQRWDDDISHARNRELTNQWSRRRAIQGDFYNGKFQRGRIFRGAKNEQKRDLFKRQRKFQRSRNFRKNYYGRPKIGEAKLTMKDKSPEYAALYELWNRLKLALTPDQRKEVFLICDKLATRRVEKKIDNALRILQNEQYEKFKAVIAAHGEEDYDDYDYDYDYDDDEYNYEDPNMEGINQQQPQETPQEKKEEIKENKENKKENEDNAIDVDNDDNKDKKNEKKEEPKKAEIEQQQKPNDKNEINEQFKNNPFNFTTTNTIPNNNNNNTMNTNQPNAFGQFGQFGTINTNNQPMGNNSLGQNGTDNSQFQFNNPFNFTFGIPNNQTTNNNPFNQLNNIQYNNWNQPNPFNNPEITENYLNNMAQQQNNEIRQLEKRISMIKPRNEIHRNTSVIGKINFQEWNLGVQSGMHQVPGHNYIPQYNTPTNRIPQQQYPTQQMPPMARTQEPARPQRYRSPPIPMQQQQQPRIMQRPNPPMAQRQPPMPRQQMNQQPPMPRQQMNQQPPMYQPMMRTDMRMNPQMNHQRTIPLNTPNNYQNQQYPQRGILRDQYQKYKKIKEKKQMKKRNGKTYYNTLMQQTKSINN